MQLSVVAMNAPRLEREANKLRVSHPIPGANEMQMLRAEKEHNTIELVASVLAEKKSSTTEKEAWKLQSAATLAPNKS